MGSCYHIIFTGTDPQSKKGGIGFAMAGYLEVFARGEVRCECVPTYHPTAKGGCWRWWLRALPVICNRVCQARRGQRGAFVYSHAGAGVSLFREAVVQALSRLCGAKTVIQLHALEIDGYLRSPVGRFLFRMAIFPASAVAVLTPWWRARLEGTGIEKRIFVIPNPLPKEWEEKASAEPAPVMQKQELTLLAMSRIEPGKGVDLVVEAMPLLPESVRLVVAGDGSQLATLQRRVNALGVGARVRFTGWVSGKEKQRALDEADVFCLPSSYDSFGMGFLEAMANGLPVVALDWGPIADVVANGRCGILIPEKDPRLLAEAIERMMDPDLRQRMGGEARRWVIEQFGAENVGRSLRAMFEELSAR